MSLLAIFPKSSLIFGEEPLPMSDDEYYERQKTINILKGNRFAAELAYSFDGFNVGYNRVGSFNQSISKYTLIITGILSDLPSQPMGSYRYNSSQYLH